MLHRSIALVVFTFFFCLPVPVMATLILEISDAGEGQTSWTFSGSSVTSFFPGGASSTEAYNVPASFVSLSMGEAFFDFSPDSNTAVFSNDTTMVSSPYFGVSVSFLSSLTSRIVVGPFPSVSTSVGDNVSVTGSFLADIPFSIFTPGAVTSIDDGDTGEWTFRVAEASSSSVVPEPSSLLLLGMCAAGAVVYRRRRKEQRSKLGRVPVK